MENKQTRVELIEYNKANSPRILGINKMKKEELLEIYSSLTKTKVYTPVDTPVKIQANVPEDGKQSFDFSKLSKEDLKYDINIFLEKQSKRLSGINSKSKEMLLNVIKHLKITKHYSKDEKDAINQKNIDELIEQSRLERTKNKIEKYIRASNDIQAKKEYMASDDMNAFEVIIEKYKISEYDYTEFEKQLDEKHKDQFEKSLLENGILPSSVIETNDEYLYKIDNLNVALAKHSYTKLY